MGAKFMKFTEVEQAMKKNKLMVSLAAASLLLSVVVSAQEAPPPGGPAQGITGQGAFGLPSKAPGGKDIPAGAFAPPVPMTEAQKLVAGLTPPFPGAMPPIPPVGPNDPKPTVDPKDFSGTWSHNQNLEFRMQRDMYGVLLPYSMDGAKVMARRIKSMDAGKPYLNASAICRPPGPQWQRDLNMPFAIFQTDDYIEFVFEEYHGRWNVVLDSKRHPAPKNKEYMGYSTGHWDGNTLVVESRDFKQALWLDVDGTPLSSEGRLIQRIRKVKQGQDNADTFLEIITTIDDPKYYTRSWSVVRTFGWKSNLAKFAEYDCEEQIGDPHVNPDAGLVHEPQE